MNKLSNLNINTTVSNSECGVCASAHACTCVCVCTELKSLNHSTPILAKEHFRLTDQVLNRNVKFIIIMNIEKNLPNTTLIQETK